MNENASPRTDRKRAARPLDRAALDALALRYVARYATSAAKLERYLVRKLRERGWEGEEPTPVTLIVAHHIEAGFIDDRAFADMRATALTRRGFGRRRIAQTLTRAGIAREIIATVAPSDEDARAAAERFARRRRLGVYGAVDTDPRTRQRHLAAMLRAGHDHDLSRRVLATPLKDDSS